MRIFFPLAFALRKNSIIFSVRIHFTLISQMAMGKHWKIDGIDKVLARTFYDKWNIMFSWQQNKKLFILFNSMISIFFCRVRFLVCSAELYIFIYLIRRPVAHCLAQDSLVFNRTLTMRWFNFTVGFSRPVLFFSLSFALLVAELRICGGSFFRWITCKTKRDITQICTHITMS